MVNDKDIINFLNQKMTPDLFTDYTINGLQIEGKQNIEKMAFATSATTEVIQKAVELKVDSLFVHHGFFWKNENPTITGAKKKKIQLLLEHNISLIAYHLPLDALEYYGNNYPVLVEIGCSSYNIKKFEDIAYIGKLDNQISTEHFFEKINSIYNTTAIHVNPSKISSVQKICIVSGNGTSYFPKVVEYNNKVHQTEKVDAFISGEGTEWVYGMAYDSKMVYSAVGHNTSEKIGPKKIQTLLEKEFSLQTVFIQENNPF